jgi:hypothetical protein
VTRPYLKEGVLLVVATGSLRSSTVLRAALFALAVSVLSAALAVPSADAGTYTARFCAEGPSSGQDKGPFERSGDQTVYGTANNCGDANGLRVSHNAGNPGNDGSYGRWLAERPDGITVSRIDYKAMGSDQSGGYVPQVVGTVGGGGLGIVNGGQELSGAFSDFSITGDTKRFGVQLVCTTGGSACAASPPSNPEVALKNVTYALSDPSQPTLSVTGGSLFEAPVQTGGQTVSFDAADSGSGVHRVVVTANGVDAAQKVAKCAVGDGVALGFTPCPAGLSGEVAIDTTAAAWRDGRNRVRTCVEDYSSASRVCSPARVVRVLNGCVGNNSAPADSAQTMELGWPGKRGVVRSRQGRARKATVRLFGPGRVPLAGAAVCFTRGIPTDDKGTERVIAAGAVTGADGRAAVRVRGQSSRAVYATYWAGTEGAITERIDLRVSPAVRLELRAKKHAKVGDRVRVVALLRGKYKENRKVCFFVSKPGRDKFACDETGQGGRARVGYEPRESGRLRFYAKVPNQRDYPYTRGHSAKKALTIEP